MKPTQKDLIDTDGENRAVRAFLLGREVGCKDYEQMRRHMTNSGFDNCWPSEFASLGGHMSKAAQQMWLRHLFALERFGAGGGEPVMVVEVEGGCWNTTESHNFFGIPDGTYSLYTRPSPTDLRAEYLRGLEDAANVCEDVATLYSEAARKHTEDSVSRSRTFARSRAASQCVEEIRALLKGKQ